MLMLDARANNSSVKSLLQYRRVFIRHAPAQTSGQWFETAVRLLFPKIYLGVSVY